MQTNDTFLKACNREPVSHTPVWIMRQAGRYLPEYRKIRAKVDFLTLCKTPELAAEVTLQPVDILGVDAAILFSDILIPVEAMGVGLEFHEEKGPVLANPVRDMAAVERLRVIKPAQDVPFVLETIKILRRELKVPLIGFAGAPFTVATYIIEGGSSKNFLNTKKMMYRYPDVFKKLMDRITATTTAYLKAQIGAGVQAVQLFDSWAGVLSPSDYVKYALPHVKKIFRSIKPLGAATIYFVNNCAGILARAKRAGADVVGVDWRLDMNKAARTVGKGFAIQGNLDPCVLFSTPGHIRDAAVEIVYKAGAAGGHIFNLGHGVLPETPVDNVRALVDAVHEINIR